MTRPPIKSTLKLAAAAAEGKLLGEEKAAHKIWKKQGITGLIRYFSEKVEPHQAIELALNLGLAYLSLSTFGTIETKNSDGTVTRTFQPLAALYGPLALQLINAPVGTVPLAQISGLALLAGMGLKLAGPLTDYSKAMNKAVEDGTWVNPWEHH